MMFGISAAWSIGLAFGVGLAIVLPQEAFPGLRPLVVVATTCLVGLSGEVMRRGRRVSAVPRPRDPRPADGRVEVARMRDVETEANPSDPRFRKFVAAIRPDAERTSRPSSTFRDPRRSPDLLGRVVVVSLFLGRGGRDWTAGEIAEAHKALFRVGEWVEREAVRWNAPVNIELSDTYFVAGDEVVDVGPVETVASMRTTNEAYEALLILTRMAARSGLSDIFDLVRETRKRLEADEVVWLIHPRCQGWSFAVPREDSELEGISLAVCYPKWSFQDEPLRSREARIASDTVAHELLHLFGATDKGGRSLSRYEFGSVTRHDVMRLSTPRLGSLRVDPATAREIGW